MFPFDEQSVPRDDIEPCTTAEVDEIVASLTSNRKYKMKSTAKRPRIIKPKSQRKRTPKSCRKPKAPAKKPKTLKTAKKAKKPNESTEPKPKPRPYTKRAKKETELQDRVKSEAPRWRPVCCLS